MNARQSTEGRVPIGCHWQPSCAEDARRERVRLGGTLNGIDYVEVGDDGVTLCVHLFGEIPAGIGVAHVRVSGGDRIVGLRALSVSEEREPEMHDDVCLRVVLDREGDFSPYCLCLVDAASGADIASWIAYPGFDPRYACAELRFRLACGRDLDCGVQTPCVKPASPLPEINYLARDYESFRQLFLDRMALNVPAWQERHVPDVGIAMIEVMAYVADYLCYYQDAVATEAYLQTARRRISVRRHARLVDYRMHDGCNARALVALSLAAGEVSLALDNLLLIAPPPGQGDVTPGAIDAMQLAAARANGAIVFEPMALDGASSITVVAAQSSIHFYSWGGELCCLPVGTTQAVLLDTAPQRALKLRVGDLLIFEEVLGPATGNPDDANPLHRHAVRLTAIQELIDPLDGSQLLRVDWDRCDALPFDLCLSVRMPAPDCSWIHDVSLARGNVLLVDHGDHVPGQCQCAALCVPPGRADHATYPGLDVALAAVPDACTRCGTLAEDCWLVPGTTHYGCCTCEVAVQDVTRPPGDTGHMLQGAPLTWAEPLPTGPHAPVCQLLARDPHQALPQLRVYGGPLADVLVDGLPVDAYGWLAQGDLLESGPDDRHYVVEMDDDGDAHLRFGDGALGRQPDAGDFFRAQVRVGNGTAGNVGRESIVWFALKSDVAPPGVVPRNPLAASGGSAPENPAQVKQFAPGAFRAKPLRAIVADDYAHFAEQQPGVQDAACQLAWTGSWFEADVVLDPQGTDVLDPTLATGVKRALWPYRRIGHDLAVLGARYVPVIVELSVCVLPDFLQAHIKAALVDRFSAGLRSDGQPGFFHPDSQLLGGAVLESALIAEAQTVTGVAHVELITLARADGGQSGAVPADGELPMASVEIAQVENDPDHPDRGSMTFTMRGGR